jgi:hypothetical protein
MPQIVRVALAVLKVNRYTDTFKSASGSIPMNLKPLSVAAATLLLTSAAWAIGPSPAVPPQSLPPGATTPQDYGFGPTGKRLALVRSPTLPCAPAYCKRLVRVRADRN